MGHSLREILIEKLKEAKKNVEIGAKYVHVKTGGQYVVENIVIREDNEDVRVIYKELNHQPPITWDRSYDNKDGFINTTEIDGCLVPRFKKIDQ